MMWFYCWSFICLF